MMQLTRRWAFTSLIIVAFCATMAAGFASETRLTLRSTMDSSTSLASAMLRSTAATKKTAKPSTAVEYTVIESHADWLELLWMDEDDEVDAKLTAVSFHASWCRYCIKFQKKFHRKLLKSPRFADQMRFASVEYSQNRKLCQSLHIDKLPTMQLYYRGDLVASFPCPPKEFKHLPAKLTHYMELSPDQLEAAARECQASVQKPSSKEPPTELVEEPSVYKRKRDRLKEKLGRPSHKK